MQKEFEARLLSSITGIEDFVEITRRGISTKSFLIYENIYKFIAGYIGKYNEAPSKDIITRSYPDYTCLEGGITKGEQKYLIDELLKSEVRHQAVEIINKGSDLVLQEDVYKGIDFLVTKLLSINKPTGYSRSLTDKESLKRLEDIKTRKESVNKGIMVGLKTGLSIFDKNFLGWLPGNLISIIGRLGVGKSWVVLWMGGVVYMEGKRVLFLSPELSIREVEDRWITLIGNKFGYSFPNSDLAIGKIDIEKYKEWAEIVSKRADWLTLDTYSGEPFTIGSIQYLVKEFNPDLLAVDGIELLQDEEKHKEKWESMFSIAYGLKGIAQNNKIVVIATAQASREAVDKMPELHHIALSDAIGRASDIVIPMMQDKEKPNVRFITIPKRRVGKVINKRIEIEFNVNTGQIGEIV